MSRLECEGSSEVLHSFNGERPLFPARESVHPGITSGVNGGPGKTADLVWPRRTGRSIRIQFRSFHSQC